jgi:ABC-type oligopeptide transport system substrate-binding subunit
MILRRTFLSAGPMAMAACRTGEGAYFGRTEPPRDQRLVYLIGAEPATLDPAKSVDLWELYIVHALFEGLTTLHPLTGEPMAGLATHYEISPDGLQYTFYLRGHAGGRGVRLPNTSDLPRELSRFHVAPSSTQPAHWSDGANITAHDFVYSWRRAVEPATAATLAYHLFYINHAADISAGRRRPDDLGIRALDAFTLQVDLQVPTPFFLQLVSNRIFCPVPRRAIEASGPAWTQPGRMISSGAFELNARRPDGCIVLTRNLYYYESPMVALSELLFVPVIDGSANINLYKTGDANLVQTYVPSLMPGLSRKKDFRSYPSFGTIFPVFNTTRPPLNDVRVRYALNMATDKRALADFMGVGRTPAHTLVPPVDGYEPPKSLPVSIDGATYDVLAFNPVAARALLRKAVGSAALRFEFLGPNLPEAKPSFEVFQYLWQETLGIELVLVTQELQTWIQSIYTRNYRHIGGWSDYGGHLDPVWFLDSFTSHSGANTAGWADPKYDAMLADAASATNRVERLRKLADCEQYLMRAMLFLPLYRDVWVYLCKPFVRGLGSNQLDRQQFKYVWIDTKWRPS